MPFVSRCCIFPARLTCGRNSGLLSRPVFCGKNSGCVTGFAFYLRLARCLTLPVLLAGDIVQGFFPARLNCGTIKKHGMLRLLAFSLLWHSLYDLYPARHFRDTQHFFQGFHPGPSYLREKHGSSRLSAFSLYLSGPSTAGHNCGFLSLG